MRKRRPNCSQTRRSGSERILTLDGAVSPKTCQSFLQASLPVVDNCYNRKVVGALSVFGEKFSKILIGFEVLTSGPKRSKACTNMPTAASKHEN